MFSNLTSISTGVAIGVALCGLALHIPRGALAKTVADYLQRRAAALRAKLPGGGA